ncbi:MAG: phospholipase D-like domain-containing protein [Candidatus Aminicenantes bacterium]|nr:phospholipase D-like domain-containing protein [Candidatus Aminicenantes bacterium]
MKTKVRAIANNDLVFLWWSVEKKIPGCLGFSVRRGTPDGREEPLPAWVGFDRARTAVQSKNTDIWPIQAFQWKDVTAPKNVDLKYRIIPIGGTPAHPTPMADPIIETPVIRMTSSFAAAEITFNRGLIATQSLNRKLRELGKGRDELKRCIGEAGDPFRERLARDMIAAVVSLLRRAQTEGGKCLCALYELTDEELISELEKTAGTEIILSNSDNKDQKDYDGGNRPARVRLHQCGNVQVHDRFLNNQKLGQRIGHNKFVVYLDGQGSPQSVVTGSTNWTPTGLCAQTNNTIRLDVPAVAGHYREYWDELLKDTENNNSAQGKELRQWALGNSRTHRLPQNKGDVTLWFSPNTQKRTKGDATPADVTEVYEAIRKASKGVLFLVFNPGSPSIVKEIKETTQKRKTEGKYLFVRGAISDAATARASAVRIYSRSVLTAPDALITGVGGIPDDFGYWVKELYKLGHAVIHDKLIVIDPFSKDSVVITGSHNLGYKASYMNDENMVIIRGNRQVAEAYATHVLDVVNHFRWRYKLQGLAEEDRTEDAWSDLEDDDRWQDFYYRTNMLKSRDRFFLEE